MSLVDFLRQEYFQARVVDKYRLKNGNVGLVVEDTNGDKRYHVEFRDNYRGPSLDNMFGILKEPFSGKSEQLDRLIQKGDLVGLTLSYSKVPLRQAYYLHSVSTSRGHRGSEYTPRLPYRSAQTGPY